MKFMSNLAKATIAFVVSCFIGVVLVSVFMKPERKYFKVEITYCDSRPKEIVFAASYDFPSNNSIRTYKEAVPIWDGHLNVCNIRVVEVLRIKPE